MKLFNTFRQHFGFRAVTQALRNRKRDKKYMRLDQARSIGILYEWSGANYHRLMQSLKSDPFREKEVQLLGYMPDNPGKSDLSVREVISVRDLNWKLIPENSSAVEHFLQKKFDIVLDLSARDHIPLLYLLATCQAGLTVSLFSARKKSLTDILIHLHDAPEMEVALKHMIHYLQQIQSAE